MDGVQVPDDFEEIREFMPEENFSGVEPMRTDFSECVWLDHIPVVDEAKRSKLLSILTKIFKQIGPIASLEMPMKDGKSQGFAFIEYETSASEKQAIDKVNGYRLDKNHIFRVKAYDELLRLADLSEEYEDPPNPPLQPRVNASSWMTDPLARDQFVLRFFANSTEETAVLWNELSRNPKLYYGGEREKEKNLTWCEGKVMWSPKGAYLATFHRMGVALWGGENMEKQGRFTHENVNRLSFSPCERYMLTCNYRPHDNGGSKVKIWDIFSKKVLREFDLTYTRRLAPHPDQPEMRVPNVFLWSPDGNYIAHLGSENQQKGSTLLEETSLIKIYSLPSMKLLDKKSLRANGVREFSWSPTDNIISYWAAESGNQPARVSLVEIPSRKEVRQKNLFMVEECVLTWQKGGDYFAVTVVRHTKSKKTKLYNLEIFRIRDAGVPVETLDVPEVIRFLAWEPNGTRFGMVVAEGSKKNVLFYCMTGPKKDRKELTLLKTLGQRAASHLYWSPAGDYCVIAALNGIEDYSGSFEFYDVQDLPDSGKMVEHYKANHVQWDPSGRVLCTAVSQPMEGMVYKFQMDNGYHLHTFQGETYYEKNVEKFYDFSWRPRPPSLLDEAAKKSVVKNLRKYERKFRKADVEQQEQIRDVQLKEFQRQRSEIRERLAYRTRDRSFFDLLQLRAELRGVDVDADENYVVETITREVLQSTKEETMRSL